MKKVSSIQENAIVDALLKISGIIKKATNTNQQRSKKTSGHGDQKQQRNEYDYDQIDDVSISPPMRTLESHVSDFNKKYAMPSPNCNRTPLLPWNSQPCGNLDKRYYSARNNRRNRSNYRESTRKRHRYENSSSISSLLNTYHRKESNKRQETKCHCQTSYDHTEYSASNC